jgi:CheY-like chemotaxis protein
LTGGAGKPHHHVLVVDDSADTRELFALHFTSQGFDVETAHDGIAAIEAARRLHPDIIVMDVMMPCVDGIRATRELKRDPRTANIPVVLLTAYPIHAIKGGVLETGATFLMKPCQPEELEDHVRGVLDARDKR